MPFESTISGPANIVFVIIGTLVILMLAACEMMSVGLPLIYIHKYFWPSHFDFFLNPKGVPKFLKRVQNPEEAFSGCKYLVDVCDVGLAVAELPLMIPVFAVFLLMHFVAGIIVWWWVPFLRPTRLLYTAICVGFKCVKFAWPFVTPIGKAGAGKILEVLSLGCCKLRAAAEREGKSASY